MALRWRADDGPTLNADLVALWYFRGSGSVLLRNPIREHSGRVFDSSLSGRGVEHQQRHCVVSLSKTHLSMLNTGSTQEDPSRHNWKTVDWSVKNQIKQTRNTIALWFSGGGADPCLPNPLDPCMKIHILNNSNANNIYQVLWCHS